MADRKADKLAQEGSVADKVKKTRKKKKKRLDDILKSMGVNTLKR